jgi:hypothetical protein
VEDDTDFEDSYIPDVFEHAHQALPSAPPIPATQLTAAILQSGTSTTGAACLVHDGQQVIRANPIDEDAEKEDEDFCKAVHESLRTKLEEDARSEKIAENLMMNKEVDIWLAAVSKVPDTDYDFVKKEQEYLVNTHASSSKGEIVVLSDSEDD